MAAKVIFPQSVYAMVKRKSKLHAIEYIRRAARAGAAYAKQNHPYEDRTGNLTRSIQSVPTADGAYLTARMPYAHFVEFGTVNNKEYPYLRPAIEHMLKLIKNKKGLEGITFEKTLWRHMTRETALAPTRYPASPPEGTVLLVMKTLESTVNFSKLTSINM